MKRSQDQKKQRVVRVTVEDLDSGDSGSVEVQDDFILVTVGDCYVAHEQVHANGTVQLTIKGRKTS